MRRIVVDANVLISFFRHRNDAQRTAAKELLFRAEQGQLIVILPQIVIFEMVHVFRNVYAVPAAEVTTMVRAAIAYPGVLVVDDCSWNLVLEHWPDRFSSIADAAIVAVAMANRFDAVATFDQKLASRMKALGVASYW